MKREEILNRIKVLDEKDITPYLYGVISDGSAMAEGWLNTLEDRNIQTAQELIACLDEMDLI